MILTKGQALGEKIANNWWKERKKQVLKIQGRAGTGKTTIVYRLVDNFGLDLRDEVLFVTYVGKATLPLRKQGLLAKTIHSAAYHREEDYICDEFGKPIIMSNGRYKKVGKFVLNESLPKKIKLIVADEARLLA